MEELKPCPFCNWPNVKCNEIRRGNNSRTGDNYQVVCNKCKARGPLVKDLKKQAMLAWNNRE